MTRIDLHTHSHRSDGLLSPSAVVELALENGVGAISLTDHDCVDGIPEAMDAGKKCGVEVLSGVELSSEFRGRDLHVLGYGVDPVHAEFQVILAKFRETRYKRGLKIIEKLNALGMAVEPAEVLAKAGKGALGRPHIAAVLVEKGYVSRTNEAFDKYIADGGPAYVPKYKMSPRQAIQYIHLAGGLAFIAHPGTFIEGIGELDELLAEGFDGIEVFHPANNGDLTSELGRIASDRNLLVSGGSDFHGFKGRDVPIGAMDVPYDVLERIKTRLGEDSNSGD